MQYASYTLQSSHILSRIGPMSMCSLSHAWTIRLAFILAFIYPAVYINIPNQWERKRKRTPTHTRTDTCTRSHKLIKLVVANKTPHRKTWGQYNEHQRSRTVSSSTRGMVCVCVVCASFLCCTRRLRVRSTLNTVKKLVIRNSRGRLRSFAVEVTEYLHFNVLVWCSRMCCRH